MKQKNYSFKIGDNIKIISGKNKGFFGKILIIFYKKFTILLIKKNTFIKSLKKKKFNYIYIHPSNICFYNNQ